MGLQKGRKVFTLQTLPACGPDVPLANTVGRTAGKVGQGQQGQGDRYGANTGRTSCGHDLGTAPQAGVRHAHAEGDRVLTAFGRLLLDTYRESDVVGRLGGDEFALVATNTSHARSMEMLQRFEKALQAYNEEQKRGYDISYGVGHYEFDPQKHSRVSDLLNDADVRMYENKKTKKLAESARF